MLSLSERTFHPGHNAFYRNKKSLPCLEIFTSQVSKIGPFWGRNMPLKWAFLSVILELFCLMTQNLPKISSLIGFIDSRSKITLTRKKCEKNTISLKFGIFGIFLRFSMISHFLLRKPKSMISG